MADWDPQKLAGKVCEIVNNAAVRCPIVLKFGRLAYHGPRE